MHYIEIVYYECFIIQVCYFMLYADFKLQYSPVIVINTLIFTDFRVYLANLDCVPFRGVLYFFPRNICTELNLFSVLLRKFLSDCNHSKLVWWYWYLCKLSNWANPHFCRLKRRVLIKVQLLTLLGSFGHIGDVQVFLQEGVSDGVASDFARLHSVLRGDNIEQDQAPNTTNPLHIVPTFLLHAGIQIDSSLQFYLT